MITLVEGCIGSGKSYYVVREILYTYFRFSEEKLMWIPRDDMEVAIYSNVDGFWLAKDLDIAIKEAGGLTKFFNDEYQEKFTRLCRHVYIIDEVQKKFDRKFYDKPVFNFFQYHRHYGVDIYLITQDVYSVAKEIGTLPEFRISAVRRSYSYSKEFRYNFMVGKDIFRRRTYRTDLRVFSAFRSSTVDCSHNVKSFSGKYFIYIGFFIFLAIVGFVFMLKYRFGSPSPVQTVVETKSAGQFKILALYSDNVLVKNLGNKKLQRVSYSAISGDLRIGAIVNVAM
ncbi:MAG TPA: zonular occludens toxin domain-containing protein [Candidatus Wunengus sp. YC65]|uniref:zonular occludens toxin domain-containing protein n=1 Tax=Candidatus Wunengus sp. YC65 TaxID=3367701 RepID=UPI004029A486